MNIFKRLFSKKKHASSLEDYLAQVERASKQVDDLQKKAVGIYRKEVRKHD